MDPLPAATDDAGGMPRRTTSRNPDPSPGLFDLPPERVERAEPAEREVRPAAPEPRATRPEPPLFTVADLTHAIAGRLESIGRVRVEGEVSGVKRAGSGHVYFDLKGDGARLDAKVWRSQVERAIRFDFRDGAQVVATGRLDVYAPRGDLQRSTCRQGRVRSGLGALDGAVRGTEGRSWPRRRLLRSLPSAAADAEHGRGRDQPRRRRLPATSCARAACAGRATRCACATAPSRAPAPRRRSPTRSRASTRAVST